MAPSVVGLARYPPQSSRVNAESRCPIQGLRPRPNSKTLGLLSFVYWFMGRPSPRKLKPRYQWLQRQVGNPRKLNDSIASPYGELARVYREMGNLRLSYTYTRDAAGFRSGSERPVGFKK